MAKDQQMTARVKNIGDEVFKDFLDGQPYIIPPGAEAYWPVDTAKHFMGDWDLLNDEKASDKDKREERRRIMLRLPLDERETGIQLELLDVFDATEKEEAKAMDKAPPKIDVKEEEPEFADLLEKPVGKKVEK
jgi:hypothetical protein